MSALDMEDLLDLERSGWDSLCEGRGGAFYSQIMTQDAVMVLVNGMILDRSAIAASLDDAPPWSEYEITDARLVAIGETAAALVYRARAVREGEEPFTALMSSVYALVDGDLRLTLYQQTAIPS